MEKPLPKVVKRGNLSASRSVTCTEGEPEKAPSPFTDRQREALINLRAAALNLARQVEILTATTE